MRHVLLLLSFCALISGCSSSTNTVAVQNGSLYGSVQLQDVTGKSPGDYSGVSVTLENTSYATSSNSSGYWSFTGIPAGNYNIDLSRAGYGLLRLFGQPVAGPGNSFVYTQILSAIPTATPLLDSARVGGVAVRFDTLRDSTHVHVTIDTFVDLRGVISVYIDSLATTKLDIFIDKTPDVQPDDVHLMRSSTQPFGFGRSEYATFSVDALRKLGISSGQTLYVSAAYFSLSGHYYDPIHNQNRPVGPGPRSNVLSVVMP